MKPKNTFVPRVVYTFKHVGYYRELSDVLSAIQKEFPTAIINNKQVGLTKDRLIGSRTTIITICWISEEEATLINLMFPELLVA